MCEQHKHGSVGAGAGNRPGYPTDAPLGSGSGSRGLSGGLIDGAIEQSRLRRAIADLDDEQRAELLDGLLEQLADGRDAGLPEELNERLLDGMIDRLIAGKRGEREILGSDGVLGELTRRLIERALGEELTEHLGYPAGQAPPGGAGNSRNGGTPKTLLTSHGKVRIDTPRDRKSGFEPQLVRKGQRRLAGLDEKIIALYAGGMTTREIETYIGDLYGPGVSRETVSRVTAGVLEDAKAWQTRPLEQIYPILYLDALVIKIRDGQAVRNFACYLAIGVNLEGDRDVLGIWFQRTEGAKFWLQVLTELKQRGVQDVLVCCVDGLTGFPDAIEAVYPKAWVQTGRVAGGIAAPGSLGSRRDSLPSPGSSHRIAVSSCGPGASERIGRAARGAAFPTSCRSAWRSAGADTCSLPSASGRCLGAAGAGSTRTGSTGRSS